MNQILNLIGANFHLDRPLVLPEAEVQLWWVDLEPTARAESRWQDLLSTDELARASRFHFARDRQRYVAARALLRTILGAYLGCDPKRCSFVYSKEQKPSLADAGDIQFNVSHSGERALLAFTRGREIGVDVEQIRHDSDLQAVARRFFSEREQTELAALPAEEKFDAFFRCWTRKEAYIKAVGLGLALPLRQFDVSLKPADDNALLATQPDAAEAARWSLRDLSAGDGYAAALCVRGHGLAVTAWPDSVACQ